MFNWAEVILLKEPQDIGLWSQSVLAMRDVKGFGCYWDIYKIDETTFGAANQRFAEKSPRKNCYSEFYWASSMDTMMHAVYGYAEKRVIISNHPPKELLLSSNCLTYNEISNFACNQKISCRRRLITSQQMGAQSYTGIRLSVRQLDYYFVAGPEDWVENKKWENEQFAAIGFRTIEVLDSIDFGISA